MEREYDSKTGIICNVCEGGREQPWVAEEPKQLRGHHCSNSVIKINECGTNAEQVKRRQEVPQIRQGGDYFAFCRRLMET